jgi:hypothetical protein
MGLGAWKHGNKNQAFEVTTGKTLASTDCGIVQVVTVDALTITLPATVVGYDFTIVNGSNAVGGVGITVAPNASDQLIGNGFTAADNKAAINTKATAQPGDMIRIIGDGVNGYMFQEVKGTWARAA